MKSKIKISLLFLMFASALQAQVSEYEYKAAFIERFTRFVEWPWEGVADTLQTHFTITIIGENPFKSSLEELFSEIQIKNKTVHLVYTNEINGLTNSNIIFIAKSKRKQLKEILLRVKGKPILIISDTKGFGARGTHINMYVEQNYIRYEINKEAIKKSSLKVSSLLLSSAKIVSTHE